MIKPSFFRTLIVLFVFTIGLILSDSYFFDKKIVNFGSGAVKKPASYFFAKLENIRFFMSGLGRIKSIIAENEGLKKANLNLLSRSADYDDLKNENDFLRKALNISPRFNSRVAYADIYHFQLGPGGYDVLINKGIKDGISDGNVIITEEGILIGKVKRVYDNFSRALVVSDPNFSVAVKILSSGTAGIAKGALDQGMQLNLIIQTDPIKEGDVIVSSGLDLIPPALVVGTVNYINAGATDLFKKVKIKPAMEEIKIGRVLIIKN